MEISNIKQAGTLYLPLAFAGKGTSPWRKSAEHKSSRAISNIINIYTFLVSKIR